MTNDEAALRATILAAPDDDAPRLIYADWLDENGQPERAEFIRVQCALARIDEESDPARFELEKRQAALLKKHQKVWLKPYQIRPDDVEFRRGLIAKVLDVTECSQATLDALLANEPLAELEWNNTDGQAERLLACPQMEYITHLNCSNVSLSDDQLDILLGATCWKRLRSLNLGWCEMPDRDYRTLFQTNLAAVDEIDLCGIEGLTLKKRKEFFSVLQRFKKIAFGYTDLHDRGLLELARLKFPRLEYLDLGAEGITCEGFLAFLGKSKMPQLRIFANKITNAGMQALADGHPWPLLEELDAGNAGFTTAAVRALARSTHFPNLRRLHVGNELNQFPNRIGDLGLKALAESQQLPKLRELDVLYNGITAKGVRYLCTSPLLGRLWKLNLNNNHIGDEGAKRLAACPAIANLRMVGLLDCNISDEGATALLTSPYWSKNVKLNMEQNSISDTLLKKIKRKFAIVPTSRFACSFAAP